MGKFDKNRLSGLKEQTTTTTAKDSDLRLKLAKGNQVLDARQILNKKKQQYQHKQQIITNKKQIINETNLSAGSLLIMKTTDDITGYEKRFYKVRLICFLDQIKINK